MEGYAKIFQLGDRNVASIKDGMVLVESKVDGSLFRIFCDGFYRQFGSKSIEYTKDNPPDKMFSLAVEQATKLLDGVNFENPIMIFCEYLKKPKHNSLCYDNVPKNNLMIFDVIDNGVFLNYELKKAFAIAYGFDYARKLDYIEGDKITLDYIKEKLETTSFLGGQKIEGIVLKNYNQVHSLPCYLGKPLMAKFVSEEFKETNHKSGRKVGNNDNHVELLAQEYKTVARWEKAVQHLKEKGLLSGNPKDIGLLTREVSKDVLDEEKENIKEELFKIFWKKNFSKEIIRGLPEWYKEKLVSDGED